MNFNILDIIALVLLLFGAMRGWKNGGLTGAINLVGSFAIFVIAYFLKNPISTYMYQKWPFIAFGGIFQGISVFNILFYEAIAYIACVVILSILLKVLLKVTGIVDKILEASVILRTSSKLIGLACGLLQTYIYVFIFMFIMAQVPVTAKYFNESLSGKIIVGKTPILSNITNKLYSSISEVYEICVNHQTDDDKTNANLMSLDVLLKYEIVEMEDIILLLDNNKLKINGIDEFIAEWEEKNEYAIDDNVSKTMKDAVDKTMEGVNSITGGN